MEYLVVLGIDEPGMGLGVVEELVVDSVGQELLEFVERRLH
jgi:hypothetical protein